MKILHFLAKFANANEGVPMHRGKLIEDKIYALRVNDLNKV